MNWNIEILRYRNIEILKFRIEIFRIEILRYINIEILKFRKLKYWDIELLKYWNAMRQCRKPQPCLEKNTMQLIIL